MQQYAKHFLPLESNPAVFNELIALLGASKDISFQDVFTLDEPALLPHPALAVILVFPASDVLYRARLDQHLARDDGSSSRGGNRPVIWFKQTIHNACGLYACLHALSNGAARKHLDPHALLSRLLEKYTVLDPLDGARVLEESAELEDAHRTVAIQGDSAVPESAEDEVDFHYICFVKSDADGRIFELDGDLNGPVDTGVQLGPEDDLLSDRALGVIRKYLDREDGNIGFNLLALVAATATEGTA